VLDVLALRENKLARLSRGVALVDDVTVFIELDVGLTDDVFVFLPRRQVERPWLKLSFTPIAGNLLVGLVDVFLRNVIAGLQLRVAAVDHANVFNDPPVADLSIRRFDESKLIDSREAREA